MKTHRELQNFWGMAGRSRRAWFSVLLGLVVGFTLASRLILPKATELKKAGQKRKANSAGCGLNSGLIKEYRRVQWPPQDNGLPATENPGSRSNNFLFVGVMTAQKYLNNRAVAAHRWVVFEEGAISLSLLPLRLCVDGEKGHFVISAVMEPSGSLPGRTRAETWSGLKCRGLPLGLL